MYRDESLHKFHGIPLANMQFVVIGSDSLRHPTSLRKLGLAGIEVKTH